MADNLNYADILSQLNIVSNYQSAITETLYDWDSEIKQIAKSLKAISENGGISQSAARDGNFSDRRVFGNRGSFGRDYDDRFHDRGFGDRKGRSNRREYKDFSDELENSLLEGFLGSDFKKKTSDIFDNLADQMGVDLEDLPGKFGKKLGDYAMSAFSNTGIGSKIVGATQNFQNQKTQWMQSSLTNIGDALNSGKGLGTALKGAASGAGQLAKTALKAAPAMIALEAGSALATAAIKYVGKQIGAIGEGFGQMFKAISAAATRERESEAKNLQYANARLREDINSMVKYPFEVLQKAADEFYSVWDQNLRVITATQGYDKAGLQDLISSFAQRLREEGLTNVISATSITENLASVLRSGLSGRIAEEFAYQATLLNNAIPTQDFFGYASTYSSIAANAIKDGKSQSEAIQLANRSLEEFASNLLYASRDLSGGFSTGLQNAQSLYEQAVKITQTSGVGNVGQISGVLTAVAGVIGAVAPDLASSITDAVYQAAIGGNSESLVALRSLSGMNASNTDFLRALSTDPQGVFATMFRNLANMYGGKNGSAFMETAEGYSSLFGLSSDAFARIDFNYLADSISNMNVDSMALSDNMAMLVSGQTTQTAEQMKMAQINKYAIEEGLSYVLDNQVARSIQEHMWDEQRSREMMEATYGVELRGQIAEAILKIKQSIENVLNLFNPSAWGKKLEDIVLTAEEGMQSDSRIATLLEAGKVGQGNALAKAQLTTRNANLNIVEDLLTMYGVSTGKSKTEQAFDTIGKVYKAFYTGLPLGYLYDRVSSGIDTALHSGNMGNIFGHGSLGEFATASAASHPSSNYKWGVMTKSGGNLVSSILSKLRNSEDSSYAHGDYYGSPTGNINTKINTLSQAIGKIGDFVTEGKSFSDWKKSVGLSDADFESAANAVGQSATSLENYFSAVETQEGQRLMQENQRMQNDWYKAGVAFVGSEGLGGTFYTDFYEPYKEIVNENHNALDSWIHGDLIDSELNAELGTRIIEGRLIDDVLIRQIKDETLNNGLIEPLLRGEGVGLPPIQKVLNSMEGHLSDVKASTESIVKQIGSVGEETIIGNQHLMNSMVGFKGNDDNLSKVLSKQFTKFEKWWRSYADRYLTFTSFMPEGDSFIEKGGLVSRLNAVKANKEAEHGDMAVALGNALSDNGMALENLKDPQMQANVLLGKILNVLITIMSQTNNVNVGSTLLDTFSALSLGTVNSSIETIPMGNPTVNNYQY